MKNLILLFVVFFASCAPQGVAITAQELEQGSRGTSAEPMPVLHAYRKKPGEPRPVQVEGYYKKDSTYITPHTRTARTTKG